MKNTLNYRILPLSCGTLTLGIAEFAMMAVLPEAAAGLGVSLPVAGHYISAYALGVCVGAPLISLITAQWPLKRILLLLAALMMLGNFAAALSGNHLMLLLTRFCAGLPHGAFFGCGSIVAEKLAERGKEARSVGLMLMGISAASVIGVPATAWLASVMDWHYVFVFIGLWGLLSFAGIALVLPPLPPLSNKGGLAQFAFLRKPEPWLILAATLLGNNGFFCFYSYIKPYLSDVAGIPAAHVGWVLLLSGIGMCVGTKLCGQYSDRFSPGRCAMGAMLLMLAGLLLAFFGASSPLLAVFATCLVSACVFGFGLCWQVMILQHSRGGEMMGVAAIQIAFNGGNAIGALCGGIPMAMGFSARYCIIPSLLFGLLAMLMLAYFLRLVEAPRAARRPSCAGGE